ncbi:MAG: type II toxin-antitoxin system Phd/YefM family antitoxin [Chloroflexota bacterium]
MKVVPIADAKARLSEYVNQISVEGPILITRNGKAAAILVAPEDDDDLDWILLSRSPRLREILDHSRKSIAEGKGIPHDEFWRQVRERYGSAPEKKRVVAEKKANYKTRRSRKKK